MHGPPCQMSVTEPPASDNNDTAHLRLDLDNARAKIGWLEANAIKHQDQLRDVVARICLAESWSKMTAARYSNYTWAELMAALMEGEKKARKSRRARARKLRRSRERLQAEKECFADLSQAYDEVSERAGTAPDTTCGHDDEHAVALTACRQALCATCYAEALEGRVIKSWQLSCMFCHRTCPLLPLRAPLPESDADDREHIAQS